MLRCQRNFAEGKRARRMRGEIDTMPSRKNATFRFVMFLLLIHGLGKTSLADTLVMPREFVDFARANGCAAIDDFFERPGMVNPPFVYGWLPGDPQGSAVFWCKKTQKSDKPFYLMFKVNDPKQLAGCPAMADWWNPPGGLSIEIRPHLDLGGFHLLTAPKRLGPKSVVANARVILDYYDGLTSVFYCYQGQWLVFSQD